MLFRVALRFSKHVQPTVQNLHPSLSRPNSSLCASTLRFSKNVRVWRSRERRVQTYTSEAPDMLLKEPVIEYTIASEEHFDMLREFVTRVTVSWEPMTVGLGGVYEDYEELYYMLLREIIPQNLSVVAIDRANDEIAGCLLNEKDFPGNIGGLRGFMNWCPNRVQGYATKTMMQLWEGVDVFKKYNVDRVFRQHDGRVDFKYRRRGVYSNMMDESLELAKLHRFPLMAAEFSGNIALKVGNRMGYDMIKKLYYEDIVIDGVKPYDMKKMADNKMLGLGVIQLS